MCDCERHRTINHSRVNFSCCSSQLTCASARYNADCASHSDEATFCSCVFRRCAATGRSRYTFRRRTVVQPLQSLYKRFTRRRFYLSCTLRFCLNGFFLWTFLVAPILSDILQHSPLSGKKRLSFGIIPVKACHPGGGRHLDQERPRPIQPAPFKLREYVPKMSELTIGASGPAEGPVKREQLQANWNPDIMFKDEEQNNEDRMMTERCKKNLDNLAMIVQNYWPGVKLRVTEAWDSMGTHRKNSLHYEGRAVDITTGDQDRSKYPMLARLAVDAGFDWVYYESESHVHCSVKSDNLDEEMYGGCFPGDATVPVPGGEIKKMSDLYPGDQVYAVDRNGNVVMDTVLTFMDLQMDGLVAGSRLDHEFVSIRTGNNRTLRLTANHLVYMANSAQKPTQEKTMKQLPDFSMARAVFAGKVKIGQYLFMMSSDSTVNQLSSDTVSPVEVMSVERSLSSTGAYAPLTNHGTIVVDNSVASCYAVVENDSMGHLVMSPVRFYHYFRQMPIFKSLFADVPRSREQGISFYSKLWYNFASHILPKSKFWGA